MQQQLSLSDIKNQFPNEWVLIGNPIMDDYKLDIISGVPIYHSQDKKEVCYLGRDKTKNYQKITIIYTGILQPTRKITGIFNRISK